MKTERSVTSGTAPGKILLFNAKVYVEKGVFAEAVLVDGGIIRAVGTSEDLLLLADAGTKTIDCGGRTLVPGFNDSHLHFIQFAETLGQAQIAGVRSIDEMIGICRRFAEQHPERVARGMHAIGWNQDLFVDEKRMPDRFDLDRISTDFPIALERVCCHVISCNTKMVELMEKRGLGRLSAGTFAVGPDGRPDGIFSESACDDVRSLIPDYTKEERRELLIRAMEYAVSRGLTSVQSNDLGTSLMDDPQGVFELYHSIFDSGEGLLRLRHQTSFSGVTAFEQYLAEGEYASGKYPKDSWLTLGPLKLFKDGSLGARTCLMKNGYVGDRKNHGLERISDEEMLRYLRVANDHGVQVVTHCIGDLAAEKTVRCYEQVFEKGKNRLRHSLIHCQITDRPLLQRIRRDDIPVFVQPIFIDYDMKIAEDLIGKDLTSTSYQFGTLFRSGVHVSYGTDCPVEDCSPFPNLYMAVTRKDKNGLPENGFYPEECVSPENAVDCYTRESAYCEFMEDVKGRIRKGYYADLVLLDRDLFTVDPMEIREILPVMTMVGGRIVYER